MHLRTSLVAIAAVVAAGLIGLSGTANAATGSFTGYFTSGNASFAGSTYGCTSGSVAGTYDTTATGTTPNIVFTSLNISCSTPVGAATVSVTPAGCPAGVRMYLPGPTRTSGLDTAIAGTAVMGTGTCVRVSGLGGLCTANSHGTLNASYNESIKTVSGVNYNEITFSGSGSLANQSGCLGLWTGTYTLNNFVFSITPPLNFV